MEFRGFTLREWARIAIGEIILVFLIFQGVRWYWCAILTMPVTWKPINAGFERAIARHRESVKRLNESKDESDAAKGAS
jgi:hypothetical protein